MGVKICILKVMRKHKRLRDVYRFPGFSPQSIVKGLFGDPRALVIKLRRRGEKRFVGCVDGFTAAIMTIR
jgi:hypothetical protein